MEPIKLAKEICEILLSKKAEDILLIDVREKTIIADYFIIATGNSTTQVKALCENVDYKLTKEKILPKRVEGIKDGRWAVMDYGDVICHIFNDESRLFYHLERLWADENNITRVIDK